MIHKPEGYRKFSVEEVSVNDNVSYDIYPFNPQVSCQNLPPLKYQKLNLFQILQIDHNLRWLSPECIDQFWACVSLPWKQRAWERSIGLKWIKKQLKFQNVFRSSKSTYLIYRNTQKMPEKIIFKTNTMCNELYYVQNFKIIGWSRTCHN